MAYAALADYYKMLSLYLIYGTTLLERSEEGIEFNKTPIYYQYPRATALTVSRLRSKTKLPVPQPLAYAVCECQV